MLQNRIRQEGQIKQIKGFITCEYNGIKRRIKKTIKREGNLKTRKKKKPRREIEMDEN